MIVKQTILLDTPAGRIEMTLALTIGPNWNDQHRAAEYLNGVTNKLGLLLNGDKTKWQPQVSL